MIITKISKFTDVVCKFLMFLIYCRYLTALSRTNNIAGSRCEGNRGRIVLMILIKDENGK